MTALFVRAAALALREVPHANGAYRDGRFELYSRINVGVVVTGGDTYVVPTVFDADQKGLEELAQEITELGSRLSAGTLAPPALSGATFTAWNAGQEGILSASIPVVSPQAGALTAGLRDLTLACDHRILYGAVATRFLQAIAHHLDGQRV